MSLLSFTKKVAGQRKPKASAKKSAKSAPTKATATKDTPTTVPSVGVTLMPILTEKSVGVQATQNAVVFRVAPKTTKHQIAVAVKAKYNINPVSVRTVQQRGKLRRRGMTAGKTAAWKKAYVTLPAGESIDLGI